MAADWRLTVRAGSKVERDRFATLDDALAAARRRLADLRDAPPRSPVSLLGREYEPVRQVAARVELARGRRGHPHGGVDVRGDGSVEAWIGLVRKRLIELGDGEDAVGGLGRELNNGR